MKISTGSRHDAAQALVQWSRSCASAGWTRATSGNFSAVLEREPLRLLISRSGADKGRLAPDDFVLVDESGRSVDPGGVPSAEAHLHLAVARRFGAGAVGHTHSTWATMLSERFAEAGGVPIEGFEMLKALHGIKTHERKVVLPIVPNSQDWASVAHAVVGRLADTPPAFLIRRHGLYAWGRDVDEAGRHLDAVEFLLEVLGREMAYST